MATPPKPPTLHTTQQQEQQPPERRWQDALSRDPALPGYLTSEQIAVLLKNLAPSRVAVLDNLSHLEAWDVRAHLNRIFGFARWSGDVLDVVLLHDLPTETRGGKSARKVAYRVLYRLTVCAPDGSTLATYTEAAIGESTMPDVKHGDAHDMAVKTAESQALKRCATNLGTQFGLSLYDNGRTEDVVRRTLVGGPQVEQ